MPDRRRLDVNGHPRRRKDDPPIVAVHGLDLPRLSWKIVLGTLVTLGTLVGSIWGGGVWWAEHQQEDVDRDVRIAGQAATIKRQAEQIRVLQEIQYQEHPMYWRNILESQ